MNHKQQRPFRQNQGQYSGQSRSQSGTSDWGSIPKQQSEWLKDFKNEWIEKSLDKEAISFAEKFGKYLIQKTEKKKPLTSNQIRNFFGEVRRIQQKGVLSEKTAFLLLRPKLAYAAKRAGNISANDFKEVMEKAHNLVMEVENNDEEFEKRFKNYVDLLEAILAYHKAYDEE
jgi:CRISPR-associated protein Csm2